MRCLLALHRIYLFSYNIDIPAVKAVYQIGARKWRIIVKKY